MTRDFFSVFNLTPSFDIDLVALQKRYFELQREFHPDRMLGKLPPERQRALQESMTTNQAYEALKSPLKRAQHLLALKGIQVGSEQDSVKPSHALLMEIMELRETLSEITSSDLGAFARKNAQDIADSLSVLSKAFASGNADAAAQETIRLGYLNKIADEIKLKAKALV